MTGVEAVDYELGRRIDDGARFLRGRALISANRGGDRLALVRELFAVTLPNPPGARDSRELCVLH
jgi:hypothetical protein